MSKTNLLEIKFNYIIVMSLKRKLQISSITTSSKGNIFLIIEHIPSAYSYGKVHFVFQTSVQIY